MQKFLVYHLIGLASAYICENQIPLKIQNISNTLEGFFMLFPHRYLPLDSPPFWFFPL